MKTSRIFLVFIPLVFLFSTLIFGADSGVGPVRSVPVETQRPVKRPVASQGWLEGSWSGTAYQNDIEENWTIKLTARKRRYRVDYPSLNCGGEWRLVRMDAKTARFREKITYGRDRCVVNGRVTIQKLNKSQVAFWYIEPKKTRVSAIAVLDRKK